MSQTITTATYSIREADLPLMVLDRRELPVEFSGLGALREGTLDNEAMARHGFPGSSADGFHTAGRITGYFRQFAASEPADSLRTDEDLVVATVVHLFDKEEAVVRWMEEVFLARFEQNIGQKIGPHQRLMAVKRLHPEGLWGEAVGVRALQRVPEGMVTATIIDFQLGRLLGVAYAITCGEADRKPIVEQLAVDLERKMVRIVLEA